MQVRNKKKGLDFTKVITLIEQMVSLLQREQIDDDKKDLLFDQHQQGRNEVSIW